MSKTYGSLVAVDGISFSVERGILFGFLGPNGAGKTTTMKMCQCVSPLSGGSLTIFGMDPRRDSREIRRHIGVVPQETNLDSELTVLENLLVYAGYYGISRSDAREYAEELIRFFELTEKRNTLIEPLSGGMKRRLLLARALVCRPDLLILDEPTIGLDPQARHHIWEHLKRLRSEGNTIVMTTHYLDEAARLCDRLVIMDQGKILVEGQPQDLVDRYIGMDIVEIDSRQDVISCLAEKGIPYEFTSDTIQVKTSEPRRVVDAVLMECSGAKVITRPATLEDLFLMLTGRRLRE